MNTSRLFVASCMALVASAFSFVVRQDVLPTWGMTFKLNATELGTVGGLAFWGMAASMAIGSFVVDALGMKRMLGMAFLCHLVGSLLTIFCPFLASEGRPAFLLLCVATFLVGSANGLVEIGINPLVATLYNKEKTHKLNVLHAWWPGGL
jgi:MFS family permease